MKLFGNHLSQNDLTNISQTIMHLDRTSVRQFTLSANVKYKKEIIKYLKETPKTIRFFMLGTDKVTGKTAKPSIVLSNSQDDTYIWSSMLPYYLETYPIRLPLEVEQHILKKLGLQE